MKTVCSRISPVSLVHEPDRHRERGLVGEVLLTAFLDRELGQAELVLAEFDGE